MGKKILPLFLLFVSFWGWAKLDERHSNFSFQGSVYTIYIASDCDFVTICEKVKGRFLNRKTKQEFQLINGKTINVGYGNNLRGFVFTDKNTEFTLRQPTEGNGSDLSRWLLVVGEKGKDYADSEVNQADFSEAGDINFLKLERIK